MDQIYLALIMNLLIWNQLNLKDITFRPSDVLNKQVTITSCRIKNPNKTLCPVRENIESPLARTGIKRICHPSSAYN